MARAIWRGTVIAESDRVQRVEGNLYFPPDSVRRDHLLPSGKTTWCNWKGEARYYDVVVGDEHNPAAAWYYPAPLDAAAHIRDHVAFWHCVEVEE